MRRSRGALEGQALTAVRAAGHPVSVAEVITGLEDPPAYTTVMTTLTRLWSKGVLTREARGRGYVYAPTAPPEATPAALAARSMHRLLEAEGRRSDVLARFVAELDATDEQYLRAVLQQTPTPPDSRDGGSASAGPPDASGTST